MKTLVTHVHPHLDDIAGIWLYQKFVPGWISADIKFIPQSAAGKITIGGKVDSNANIVHVGVARGKYDEHKGNLGECATTLVYKDLKRRKLLPSDPITTAALKQLTDFVLEGDLGKRLSKSGNEYNMDTVILWIPDSIIRTRVGFVMLDALLNLLKDRVMLDKDWRNKKVFGTPWGRGVGLKSTIKGTIRAFQEGYVLIAQVDPKRGFRAIRAAENSKVDLTAAYARVKKLEPKAEWYLHHSKKMLICGSDVAPQGKMSKLSLEELIDLVRK